MSLFAKKPSATEDRDISKDVDEHDFIPYACHWNPTSIVTKNGEVLQIIKIASIPESTKSSLTPEETLRSKIREALTTCIPSSKFAFWVHTVRKRATHKTGGEYARNFAGYLNRYWNDKHRWENTFENEIYITLMREGEQANITNPLNFARGIFPFVDIKHREKVIDAYIKEMDAVTASMLSILEGFGAQRLGVTQREGQYFSEPTEFLSKLSCFLKREIPLQDIDLSALIADYEITFGFNALEIHYPEKARGKKFAAFLTVKESSDLEPDILEHLLQMPLEFMISESVEFVSEKLALKKYEKQKQLLETSGSKELGEKIGVYDIFSKSANKETNFCARQISFVVLGDSPKQLENNVASIAKMVANFGIIVVREDIALEECYWAHLPANFEFVRRQIMTNIKKPAGFANLPHYPTGKKEGNHWGDAVTTLPTAARTPYFFNFHKDAVGHTAIISRPELYKTSLTNFLLCEAQKFSGKLYYFDVSRGGEILIRSLGGNYFHVISGAKTAPYSAMKINPFQLDNTPENLTFLQHWMHALVGSPVTSSVVTEAITAVMALPKTERNLTQFATRVQSTDSEIFARLSPFVSGKFSHIFAEGEESDIFSHAICGFEVSAVLRQPELVAPMMYYLLHRVQSQLDGTPAMIVFSEFWYMMCNDFMEPRIADLLDTLTQKNAIAILCTEHVDDAVSRPMTQTLMHTLPTQIYLPDNMANIAGAGYDSVFGLSPQEIEYVTLIAPENGYFLIKQGTQSVIAGLDFAGMPDINAVLHPYPEHLRSLEKAIETRGLTPSEWMPTFLELI